MDNETRPVRNFTVVKNYGKPSGFAYFLGFIGAFIYYMQKATTFGMGVIGFLKAIVWPAFLVFHLFKFLGL